MNNLITCGKKILNTYLQKNSLFYCILIEYKSEDIVILEYNCVRLQFSTSYKKISKDFCSLIIPLCLQ